MRLLAAANSDWGRGSGGGWTLGEMIFATIFLVGLVLLIGWVADYFDL